MISAYRAGTAALSAMLASRVAAARISRLRRPFSGSVYLLAITSPCSVRRSAPSTLPGGCDSTAS
jgi:hypothetical protein